MTLINDDHHLHRKRVEVAARLWCWGRYAIRPSIHKHTHTDLHSQWLKRSDGSYPNSCVHRGPTWSHRSRYTCSFPGCWCIHGRIRRCSRSHIHPCLKGSKGESDQPRLSVSCWVQSAFTWIYSSFMILYLPMCWKEKKNCTIIHQLAKVAKTTKTLSPSACRLVICFPATIWTTWC